MTENQALQQAQDRWGKDVRVEEVSLNKKSSRHIYSGGNTDIQCRVGTIKIRPVWGTVFEVKGFGQTWEEAFKNADNKKNYELMGDN